MAAAEMQLLRQALDKLQSETQVLDDELARAREQAIFSELERAELSHDLEMVTAQLQSSEASKAELEGTISKVSLLVCCILWTILKVVAVVVYVCKAVLSKPYLQELSCHQLNGTIDVLCCRGSCPCDPGSLALVPLGRF